MYDVLYLGSGSGCQTLACGLDVDSAARIARDEARRRRSGRMFLTGSAYPPRSPAVLIVQAGRRPI